MREEGIDVDFFAAAKNLRQSGVEGRGKKLHRGGLNGRDDNRGFAGSDFPEGFGALLLDVGVGREIFEGQNVVGGQTQHAIGGNRHR